VAEARGIEVPITRAVHAVLFEGMPLAKAMDGLLGRISFDEFYDVR
jgi:glycerol-3-phosphate dehydrogenase